MVFRLLGSAQVREQDAQPGLIHGTIDVVISTREGFVVATDSRGSNERGLEKTYTDDVQKLFPIGDHTACVITGVSGSELGSGALRPREAIGTDLMALDRLAARRPVTAKDVAVSFKSALGAVGGLLDPHSIGRSFLVGELSVVSLTPSNGFEWISFVLPLHLAALDSGYRASVGNPVYTAHETHSGLRFDVETLGQPAIADWLLRVSNSGPDSYSQSAIMKRYYALKTEGQLDQFTLDEAILLARELVQATIDLAPQTAGVHGPIDIATLTGTGLHWIQRKHAARFPSPHPSVSNSRFRDWHQPLENLQCIHCDFTDTQLVFNGNADVQLLDSTFGGNCRLFIAQNAKRKMPEVVSSLKQLVEGKCRIIEQN